MTEAGGLAGVPEGPNLGAGPLVGVPEGGNEYTDTILPALHHHFPCVSYHLCPQPGFL